MNFKEFYFTESAKDLTGSALYTRESSKEKLFVLYDPVGVKQALMEDKPIQGKYIYGGITIKPDPDEDAYEVDFITAKKGYGPILYMLAMHHIMPKGLRSNKKGVALHAKSILENFFSGKGKDKVIAKKLKNKTKWHEEYLNYKYILKNKLNVSGSKGMNKKVIDGNSDNEERLFKSLRKYTRSLRT